MASGVGVGIADVEKILNDPALRATLQNSKNRFQPTKGQCNAFIDLNQLQANGRVMPRSATQWQSVAVKAWKMPSSSDLKMEVDNGSQ